MVPGLSGPAVGPGSLVPWFPVVVPGLTFGPLDLWTPGPLDLDRLTWTAGTIHAKNQNQGPGQRYIYIECNSHTKNK